MNDFLAEIIAEKRKEVRRLKADEVAGPREKSLSSIRDFKTAISRSGRINLIAEIKFASPSAGLIRGRTDALTIGQMYETAGAAAISLLTDKRFFKGDINQLPRLKRAVSLPILRKDFIIDESQVRESFFSGADAILLIPRILSRQQLKKLLYACHDFGIDALTEVHDRDDLQKAMDCGAEIIGINNRNLDSFEVDLKTTVELAPLVPAGCVLVSESGIKSSEDIQWVKQAGIQAILVGTGLMRTDDILKKTQELVEAGSISNDE